MQVLMPDIRSPRYKTDTAYRDWCDKLAKKEQERIRQIALQDKIHAPENP